MPAASSMRAALVLTEDSFLDISFIVGRGPARRAKDNSPRRTAVGSRRAAFASPGTGRKRDRRAGSSAPSPGLRRDHPSPVLTHWATVLRPSGLEEAAGQRCAPPGGPTWP